MPTNSQTSDFSLAFQQLASFVAIAKTRNTTESYDEIIKQCYVVLPDEPLGDAVSLIRAIETIYPGIKLDEADATSSVQRLVESGDLVRLPGGHLGLNPQIRANIESRIQNARHLEETVKQSWLSSVSLTHPGLDSEGLWKTLKSYLAAAFLRHGVQAVMLLDPTIEISNEQPNGLAPLLHAAITKEFRQPDRANARDAVKSFFDTVNLDRQRAEYIAQLADAAFNYFTLSVAPNVANELRSNLYPITLFLDTNFLFGILKLHVNSQVDVSIQLIEAVKRFKLPFNLRYHEATKGEMNNTLLYFGNELRRQTWPPAISRAAVTSGRLSGIERRYHQLNAQVRTEVSDFLAPYLHWEVLLKEMGIDVYRVDSSQRRLYTRANLEADYRGFLSSKNIVKPDEAILHDMAVLETVESLRTNATSSLDAGALLVSCDNQLFRFDQMHHRTSKTPGCVVVPSIFWQILRPFISSSVEFDQAFAETFTLPEFSLTRGGAARAATRMLGILATYQDIPEEIASRMLANDLLLEKLHATSDEQEFLEIVESAMMKEAAELIEEKAALSAQLAIEEEKRKDRERELFQAEQRLAEQQEALLAKETALENLQAEMQSLGQQIKDEKLSSRELIEQLMREKEAEKEAQKRVAELDRQREDAEHQALRTRKATIILIGSLTVLVFELLIHFVIQWGWLLSHPNSYGLQASASVMIFTAIVGLGVKPWRKVLWVSVLSGAGFVLLQLLGGPTVIP